MARHSGRTLHSLAVPFAYICLFAHLSCFAHFVLVRHGACAEHGEVIDLGNNHAKAHANNPARTAESSVVAVAFRAGEQSSGDEHDHCVLSHEPRSQNKPASVSVGMVETWQQLSLAQSDQRQLGSVAVYRLAPKTSPPV